MARKKVSGIYRIVCTKNGRYYYGSSVDIHNRWSTHKSRFRKGEHDNPIMQNVWNKWGEENFRIEIIKQVSKKQLLKIEQRYLDEHVGKRNCMNILSEVFEIPSQKGRTHSEETRQKMSVSSKLAWQTVSVERQKYFDSITGENNHMYGKKHSAATRKRWSKLRKGRVPWNKGLTYTFEERRNLRKEDTK